MRTDQDRLARPLRQTGQVQPADPHRGGPGPAGALRRPVGAQAARPPLIRRILLAGLLGLGAAGPAGADPLCDGARTTLSAQLLFGLSRPDGGRVPGAAFDRFLAERITPRFPEGLTVFAGRGQWRGPDGRIVHEAARIVLIVTEQTPEAVAALREIREAYRRRFVQGAVGLVLQRSCALF
ncbi:hypothetical protein MOTC310_21305 [Methylobacterium oryzae]|uniref:DUF3574 domain-containing protein n=1 Tax=Methylobacterium oryzae TaxID=334852 RepID=A0ABU7TTD3_9HYPH